jgi:hypothetical protein
LVGQIVRLDGKADLNVRSHEYHAPLNVDALGEPFVQRREPYVELTTHDDHCRIASVFSVQKKDEAVNLWRDIPHGLAIDSAEGEINVILQNDSLQVTNLRTDSKWTVSLASNTSS